MTTLARPDPDTLCTLADWDAPLLVSAFIPIDFSRPQPAQTITKALRHAAQVASATLIAEHGLQPGAAAEFVAPLVAESLLDDVPTSARGLAVFLSPGRALHVSLPTEVGPAVDVGDHLDVLRLLPVFVENIEFFAITIGKKGAQLFRGSRFDFKPVEVEGMPDSIEEALWYIRREPNRHGPGAIHGTGGGAQDLRKDDVRQYIHLIDKAIAPTLNGADEPLVVIGVEYEAAMFINHTHYRHTVDIPISGSPDSMQQDELHRRSWAFVRSQDRAASAALDQLRQLAGTGKTATDTDEVVAVSRSGSVSDLLVARSATEGETTNGSAVERRRIAASVIESLRHRSRIHIVDDDDLPDDTRVAAVLRY